MQNISEYLQNNANENIEQKEKSCGLSIALLIIGIVLIVMAATPIISNPYLSLTVIFIGIAILIWGIIDYFAAKGANRFNYIHMPTGEILKHKYIHIDDATVRAIKSNNISEIKDMKPAFQSSHCLEVYAIPSGKFIIAQLNHYESSELHPVTDIQILEDEPAAVLSEFINK